MAGLGSMASRRLTRSAGVDLRFAQRRWARVLDVRFLATQQSPERVIDRYRQKLDQKAKREGLRDFAELKEAYKDKITELRKKAVVPGATGPLKASQPPSQASFTASAFEPSPPPPPAQPLDQFSPSSPHFKQPGLKTLSSFLDVSKTLTLPPKEIESIWRLRHAHNKQSLCAAMPASTFTAIAATAKKHPQFILPGFPRKSAESGDAASGETAEQSPHDGAPIHFLQWTFPGPDTVNVMFTHLAEYKLRGEYSQPHTTMTHHLELAGPKGLVLCQGSVLEGRGVSVEEGKWLIMCLQKFYNTTSIEELESLAHGEDAMGKELKKRRRRLMEQFSSGDEEFRIETLLEEAERIG